jgi:hypothetical protein
MDITGSSPANFDQVMSGADGRRKFGGGGPAPVPTVFEGGT